MTHDSSVLVLLFCNTKNYTVTITETRERYRQNMLLFFYMMYTTHKKDVTYKILCNIFCFYWYLLYFPTRPMQDLKRRNIQHIQNIPFILVFIGYK